MDYKEEIYGKDFADARRKFDAEISLLNDEHSDLLKEGDKVENHFWLSINSQNGIKTGFDFMGEPLDPFLRVQVKQIYEKHFVREIPAS